MKLPIRNLILMLLMLAASGMAVALKPTKKIADQRPKLELETLVPKSFGDWRQELVSVAQVVDPQQKQMIDKIYNQTLTRTYVNSKGERIMLSIAYGGDQSDSLTVHMPEGCYAGQGFQIRAKSQHTLAFDGTRIPLVRLHAEKGPRSEPISYWIFIGEDFATSRAERKIAQLRSSLLGTIPEGILVRVSNISPQLDFSYTLHENFIQEMVSAIPLDQRQRISG